MRAMMEGWPNLACLNLATVMFPLGWAASVTLSKSQLAASVPVLDW